MLYKRAGSQNWYVKLKSQGRVIQRSTGTSNKKRAQAVEKQIRDELWRLKYAPSAHTFDSAALRWIKEKQHKKSLATDLMILEWFAAHLGGMLLSEITRDKVEELRELRLQGSSTETVNRYMALLRAILRTARDDWEWIEKIPKVPMYPREKRGPRYLSDSQFISLVTELPPSLSPPAWLAISTGLRTAALRGLRWSWISREGVRFPPEVMKNNEWLVIPLSQTAWHVLAEQWGKHPEFVFVNHKGEPWADKFTTKAWRKACERCGLQGVSFHDLRHTFASWHLQAGTPIEVVQELGGWKDYQAMKIYAHHSSSSLSGWADNLEKKGEN